MRILSHVAYNSRSRGLLNTVMSGQFQGREKTSGCVGGRNNAGDVVDKDLATRDVSCKFLDPWLINVKDSGRLKSMEWIDPLLPK